MSILMEPSKPKDRPLPDTLLRSRSAGKYTSKRYDAVIPITFVLIWSTGFIGAKLGLPYSEPFTFLSYRFGLTLLFSIAVWLVIRSPGSVSPAQFLHSFIVGISLHALQLGGVFSSIDLGLPAGIASLCMGINPLLTAILARPLLGENITKAHWIGLFLGLVGIILVLHKSILAGNSVQH